MSKTRYKSLGLMSGTSLDGVDAAVIETDGEQVFGFGLTYFRPYSSAEQDVLEAATGAALDWRFNGPPPNNFARISQKAEAILHQAHIEAAQAVMSDEIDIIGFHGQTVLHNPPKSKIKAQTLQLGDGQVLADALGVDVVYDFRTADVRAGGQGAPLVPAYHKALVTKSKLALPVAILNIGGVSNITLVGEDGTLQATDCGPGNGPLDSWVQMCGLGHYDKDGALALQGAPDFARVEKWLTRTFFAKPVPKSADRHDFDVFTDLHGLSPEDGAATLVGFTAMAIARTLDLYDHSGATVIVCGGGRHNPAMIAALREQHIGEIVGAEQVGWHGDDMEAEAFAFLAVRSVRGLPLSYPGTTGANQPICGGLVAKAPNEPR